MRDLNAWLESKAGTKDHRSFASLANAERALERFQAEYPILSKNHVSSLIYRRVGDGRFVVVLINAEPVAAHHFPIWS
jgi:hypothetical protein